MDREDAAIASCIQIALLGSAPSSQPRGKLSRNKSPDVIAFRLSHGGNATLQLRNSEVVECTGNLQLVFARERDPRRLFSVAQGAIDNPDARL